MFVRDYDLLFPPRVVSSLRDLRGEPWRNLVDHTTRQEPTAIDWVTFVLMMARLSGCTTCHPGSYRALRGCTQCAQLVVRRYEGSDLEFVHLFKETRQEIDDFLAGKETDA